MTGLPAEGLGPHYGPHRGLFDEKGDYCSIVDAVSSSARQHVGGPAVFRRLYTADHSRYAVILLHRIYGRESELLVLSHRMIWTPGVVRGLAYWLFVHLEQRRVLARCAAGDERTQSLIRRLGFVFEGRARAYFADDLDASVWAMAARDCPWLSPGLTTAALGAHALSTIATGDHSHGSH